MKTKSNQKTLKDQKYEAKITFKIVSEAKMADLLKLEKRHLAEMILVLQETSNTVTLKSDEAINSLILGNNFEFSMIHENHMAVRTHVTEYEWEPADKLEKNLFMFDIIHDELLVIRAMLKVKKNEVNDSK